MIIKIRNILIYIYIFLILNNVQEKDNKLHKNQLLINIIYNAKNKIIIYFFNYSKIFEFLLNFS